MTSADTIRFAKAISRFLGWIYTLSWSLSFYPQPLLNFARQSTLGTTIDFPAINFLGFACYFLSTVLLFSSPLIRSQYAYRNPVSPEPTVRGNDVAFTVHGLLLCAITISMFWGRLWGLEQVRGQRVSRSIMGIGVGCVVGVFWVIGIVLVKGRDGGRDAGTWAWIDVVYALGYCKLVITVVKYIPQAYANYQRKSTTGWSIEQILFDLIGGVLSIVQLVIDSSLQNDWSGLTGNPVKLGLGNVSIFFDLVFMVQHYWLYRHVRKVVDGEAVGQKVDEGGGERSRLLDRDEDGRVAAVG